jgi:altronate dehydratase
VIKVGTRSELAQRWHDLIDLNAGIIADGQASVEETGWALFRLMLEVASGRRTWAERWKLHNALVLAACRRGRRTWAERWKLHNALVLFNPAPVT